MANPGTAARAIDSFSVSDDGLAVPIDPEAGYGRGLGLGLSLGGGGVFFVAWQVTYLNEMAKRGIDLAGADRVVGTSAGSVVSAVMERGGLGRLDTQLRGFAKVPALVGLLAPASSLHPSQQRALERFRDADDAQRETIVAIGHAALAARTPSASTMARNVGLLLLSRKWPAPNLHVTCVDTYSGDRCVVTAAAKVPIARAVAASSAVPGLFAPQPIVDRRCMDGGVAGSGTPLDLLSGAERIVVLSLTDGAPTDIGLMTQAPGAYNRELTAVRQHSEVFVRSPISMDVDELMDPRAIPKAIAMAESQADADADELRDFLA